MTITKQQVTALVSEVQKGLSTSNQLVNRVDYPYYHSHPSVPDSLTIFKRKLDFLRRKSSELILKQPELPFPNAPHTMRSFSVDTFAHQLTVALTVASFGLGDCGECATRLGFALIKAGCGNLAFIAIKFVDAKEGMETIHELVVANLPSLSLSKEMSQLSVFELFSHLAEEAIVADPFLGLTFSPTDVPKAFTDYICAYGRETQLIQCQHFYNLPSDSKLFTAYQSVSATMSAQLRLTHAALNDSYEFDQKSRIRDTILISRLKEKTGLPFFGVCSQSYEVDAVLEIPTLMDKSAALKLQHKLGGAGKFFISAHLSEFFVITGVNLSDKNMELVKLLQI